MSSVYGPGDKLMVGFVVGLVLLIATSIMLAVEFYDDDKSTTVEYCYDIN